MKNNEILFLQPDSFMISKFFAAASESFDAAYFEDAR